MPRSTTDWDVATVALMRASIAELGDHPDAALRLVLRLSSALVRLMAQLPGTLGMSGTDLRAMIALWGGGRCTLTELGERLGMSRAAITTLADRCEQAGWMVRVPDQGDRRRVLAMPTPRFEAKLFAALEPLAAGLEPIAGGDQWKAFALVADTLHDAAVDTARRLNEQAPQLPPARRSTRDLSVLDESW